MLKAKYLSMKTILVENSENYRQEYFLGYNVIQKMIQSTEWLLKNSQFYSVDHNGNCQSDMGVGAIRPTSKPVTVLEMISLSRLPCVNASKVLLQGFDRLTMLNVLKVCNLLVILFNVSTSSNQIKNIEVKFPFVIKT